MALRRSDNFISINVNDIKIEAGDTLLVIAKDDFYEKYSMEKDFYLIIRIKNQNNSKFLKINLFGTTFELWWYQYLSYAFFVAMLALAVCSNLLGLGFPLVRCSLICAVLMILFGLISSKDATHCVDAEIIVLISASIAIGTSILESGLASLFGEIISLMGIPAYLLPGILAILCGVTTQFIHVNFFFYSKNVACAAIFFPLSIGVADHLNLNYLPLVIAISLASQCSFATPIGYECCMLVQSPGGYKFKHYAILGVPLLIIFFVVASILIPIIWPVYKI
jgi:di/tricarboxylate transporter